MDIHTDSARSLAKLLSTGFAQEGSWSLLKLWHKLVPTLISETTWENHVATRILLVTLFILHLSA